MVSRAATAQESPQGVPGTGVEEVESRRDGPSPWNSTFRAVKTRVPFPEFNQRGAVNAASDRSRRDAACRVSPGCVDGEGYNTQRSSRKIS